MKIVIAKGEPILLIAKVQGSPEIQWSKDRIPIKQSEDVHLEQKPDGTVKLEIDSAKESDSGRYELKASNSEGTATSAINIQISGKWITIHNWFLKYFSNWKLFR